MKEIFNHDLNAVKQNIELTEKPDEVALLETLFQKRK